MLAPICQDEHSLKEFCHWSPDQKHDLIPFTIGKSPQVHIKTCYYTIEQGNYCQETRKAPDGVPDNLEVLKLCGQVQINHDKMLPITQMSTDTSDRSREENPSLRSNGLKPSCTISNSFDNGFISVIDTGICLIIERILASRYVSNITS